MKIIFNQIIFILFFILVACTETQNKNETNDTEKPIYLGPIEYDTLRNSIKDRITCKRRPVNGRIPNDEIIKLTISYKGELKDYMKHGMFNIEPRDSTVKIWKVNDSTFYFQPYKPYKDGVVSMYFIPTLKYPYHLICNIYNEVDTIKPGEEIPMFLRSFITD